MRARLIAMGRAIAQRVIETVEGPRAKPLPRRARTLTEFWKTHHGPALEEGRPGTRRQHSYRWRYWIEPALGALRWSEIDKRRIAAFISSLRTQAHCNRDPNHPKISPRTVGNIFATLSGMFAHAVALDYVETNPCVAARRYLPDDGPAARNIGRAERLAPDHAVLLITSPVIALHMRREYAFTIYTCVRRGEVHGLRWSCVHMDTETPHVVIQRSHDGPTKSGKTREIPIHSELMPILRAMDAERDPLTKQPSDLVFPACKRGGRVGRTWSPDVTRMQRGHGLHHLRATLVKLKLPVIVFHGLRKTGATIYRAAGMSHDDVADILGHSLTITDLYAPPQLHILKQKMEKLRLLARHFSPTGSSGGGGDSGGGSSREFDVERSAVREGTERTMTPENRPTAPIGVMAKMTPTKGESGDAPKHATPAQSSALWDGYDADVLAAMRGGSEPAYDRADDCGDYGRYSGGS